LADELRRKAEMQPGSTSFFWLNAQVMTLDLGWMVAVLVWALHGHKTKTQHFLPASEFSCRRAKSWAPPAPSATSGVSQIRRADLQRVARLGFIP